MRWGQLAGWLVCALQSTASPARQDSQQIVDRPPASTVRRAIGSLPDAALNPLDTRPLPAMAEIRRIALILPQPSVDPAVMKIIADEREMRSHHRRLSLFAPKPSSQAGKAGGPAAPNGSGGPKMAAEPTQSPGVSKPIAKA